ALPSASRTQASRGRATQPAVGRVEAALEAVVVAPLRARIDVAPVDADGGRAEEPLGLCGLQGLDAAQVDLRPYAGIVEQLPQVRQVGLVVRAAVEVEELDRHDSAIPPHAEHSARSGGKAKRGVEIASTQTCSTGF